MASLEKLVKAFEALKTFQPDSAVSDAKYVYAYLSLFSLGTISVSFSDLQKLIVCVQPQL